MEPSINKQLIQDHLAGKSSPIQKRSIEAWLQTAGNKELFYQWLAEWENQSPQYLPELDERLTAYVAFLEKKPELPEYEVILEEENAPVVSRNFWLRWLSVAAVLLLLGWAGWYEQKRLFFEAYHTGYNETKSIELSDGSTVVLNSNSCLRVPRFGFGSQTREVLLTGEANFSVSHTIDDQPFLVRAGDVLEVVVLGTEFTVYARDRGSKVVLNKGKVQLRYQQGDARKNLTMKPGDLVTLAPDGNAKLRRTASPQNYAAWAAHRFVFEGTSLEELTYLFAENFGLKIRIKDADLNQLTLYGSFQAETAEELLRALTDAASLSYSTQGDTIVITRD